MTTQASATILIIDDSAESLRVLSEQLRPQYRVLAAASGEDGLHLANGRPAPDLILLDVMMPGLDGYEVLARLREDSATRDIPVIFLTALDNIGDMERGFQLGAADYIIKQNQYAVVLARIKTQLEAKRARDWLKNQNTLLEAEVTRRTAKILEVQHQLQATLDAIPDLLFEVGPDGYCYNYYCQHTHLLFVSIAKFLGKKVSEVLPPAAAGEIMSALQEAHEEGRSYGKQFELQLPQGNFWFELSVSRKPGDTFQDARFIVISRDITERKIAERQFRDLTAHLQTVREEEKASIAREIHDDLGGTLTALKMKTYLMVTKLTANREALPLTDHLGEMSALIDQATGAMRKIITGLRPTILDDLGLLAALEWQAAQFQKLTGIHCQVNNIVDDNKRGLKSLDKLRSIALFRIAQESLTNVTRHSGASRVEIELYRNEEEIVMSVMDNGCGMRPDGRVSSNSYGMLGMSERVDQLGGTISFDTFPIGGFCVTVTLPPPASEGEKQA